jgi:hypothetical protein
MITDAKAVSLATPGQLRQQQTKAAFGHTPHPTHNKEGVTSPNGTPLATQALAVCSSGTSRRKSQASAEAGSILRRRIGNQP